MGVRLNALANPLLNLGLAANEADPRAGSTSTRAVEAEQGTGPASRLDAVDVASGTEDAIRRVARPKDSLEANRFERESIENEPREVRAAEPRPEPAEVVNIPTAPRLRDFRFLMAAESLRERELETRLVRLERELEAAGKRLQNTDSFSVRLDAQLERAKLESDFDKIKSEIGRIRLERAFARPSVGQSTETRSSVDRVSGLNLIA